MRILGLAFMIALTGAMSPGPFLVMVIGQVLAQGLLAVVWLLLGHACLEAVLVAGVAKGLGRHLQGVRVRATLGLVGGAVMVWMGQGIVEQAVGATLAGDRAAVGGSWPSLFMAGVVTSLSNPYFTGWWATVGTGQMATLGLRTWRDYAVFLVGHEVGDVAWYLLVAVVLVSGRGWLTDSLYEKLLWGAGGLVIALGGLFLVIGLRLLLVRPRAGEPAAGVAA